MKALYSPPELVRLDQGDGSSLVIRLVDPVESLCDSGLGEVPFAYEIFGGERQIFAVEDATGKDRGNIMSPDFGQRFEWDQSKGSFRH